MSTGYFISLCSNNRTRSKFLSVYYYLVCLFTEGFIWGRGLEGGG